jgi:YesN/AraC family two-component response regulator
MLNVLYVDDEQINLELLEMTFRREFKIHKSISAAKALELLHDNSIDVIISDLKMPEMDGIEFIRLVKTEYPNMNCILLTGYYEPKLVDDPEMKSMLFKYVLKPFKKEELRILIIEASGKKSE